MQGTSLGVLGDPLITLEVLNFGNEIQVHKGFRLNFLSYSGWLFSSGINWLLLFYIPYVPFNCQKLRGWRGEASLLNCLRL